MTKAEMMQDLENHETVLAEWVAKRAEADEKIGEHESEIELLWGKLRELGVTRARKQKATAEGDAPKVARKRNAKKEEAKP